MPREIAYNAAESIHADDIADPYLRPAFSRGNQAARLAWNVVHVLLYRTSPKANARLAELPAAQLRGHDGGELPLLPGIEDLGTVELTLRGSGNGSG